MPLDFTQGDWKFHLLILFNDLIILTLNLMIYLLVYFVFFFGLTLCFIGKNEAVKHKFIEIFSQVIIILVGGVHIVNVNLFLFTYALAKTEGALLCTIGWFGVAHR